MIEILDEQLQPAERLFVAFTGIKGALGGVPFEFVKSLQRLDGAALYVRDLGPHWYQDDGDAEQILTAITQAVEKVRPSRLICLGNSMGGFGALYFGARANAHSILAFAPQTAIDPTVTARLGDHRWRDYQQSIVRFPFGDLTEVTPPAGVVKIVVGSELEIDVKHAKRLLGAWPAQIVVVSGGHDAIHTLKAEGRLLPLIDDA